MHRHITYYIQSTVCQGGFSNNFLINSSWAYAGFAMGGGATIFFLGGGACDAWRRHAFARGVRGHASPKKNFEWCNFVRFGAYFHNFFTFKKSKNVISIQKIIINCSHVLASGSRSMVHSPLIILIKGAIYHVFDTISPSIIVLIFTFYTRNSDYYRHAIASMGARKSRPSPPPPPPRK